MAASAPVGFNSAAVVHLNGTRQPIHRATQAYRGECAFSPPVPPVHPQPFSLLAKGSSCPSTYSVLGGVNKGSGSAVTRSFTPGKALAKAALGSLQGVRNYLAENGAVNAQLDVGELLVLHREVGGSSFKGNPAQKQSSGNISIGDTMLHICVRHRNKALARSVPAIICVDSSFCFTLRLLSLYNSSSSHSRTTHETSTAQDTQTG